MKHLLRAGVVLVVVIFIAFILPKLLPTSQAESLQPYGFYAGHNNSQEWKQVPVSFVDTAQCSQCHSTKFTTWSNSVHKPVSCESCHGSGSAHIEKAEPLVVNTSKELCENCHSAVVGRPETFPQVDTTVHGRGLTCISCHNPHDPSIPGIPHDTAGRTDCLGCHNTSGIKPVPEDHVGRTSDICWACHQPQGK